MSEPPLYEVFFFTRYLFHPWVWHPDGCTWEFYYIGQRVTYQGRRATIQWRERDWLHDWIRLRYDESPYPVPNGVSTYEEINTDQAIADMTLQPLYEDEYGHAPEESIGGAELPGWSRRLADPAESRLAAAFGVSTGQCW